MELATKQVIEYAKKAVERHSDLVEPLTEMRVGAELAQAMRESSLGEDMKKVMFKTVGRILKCDGIQIKLYDDATGGIIISCDGKLGISNYEDGEVFVYQGTFGLMVFSHGDWERVLAELAK